MVKCKTLKEVENRDEQFEHIAVLKNEFAENQLPVLSIHNRFPNRKAGIFAGNGKSQSGAADNHVSALPATERLRYNF
jgi:hypothetical protein